MTKERPLRPGDYVRVTKGLDMEGRAGFIKRIYRANRDYERRAEVQFSAGLSMTIAVRFLEHGENA